MAIDQATITDAIFNGTWSAADDAISPGVDGYRAGACEYCALDVERANQLLDEAGRQPSGLRLQDLLSGVSSSSSITHRWACLSRPPTHGT
jgi:ABC-type transport system substrate-binding protein